VAFAFLTSLTSAQVGNSEEEHKRKIIRRDFVLKLERVHNARNTILVNYNEHTEPTWRSLRITTSKNKNPNISEQKSQHLTSRIPTKENKKRK
jgi:hypothetical protein